MGTIVMIFFGQLQSSSLCFFFQTCMAQVFSNHHNSLNKHIKFKKFGGKIAQLFCLDLYKYKIFREIDSNVDLLHNSRILFVTYNTAMPALEKLCHHVLSCMKTLKCSRGLNNFEAVVLLQGCPEIIFQHIIGNRISQLQNVLFWIT